MLSDLRNNSCHNLQNVIKLRATASHPLLLVSTEQENSYPLNRLEPSVFSKQKVGSRLFQMRDYNRLCRDKERAFLPLLI